MALGAKEMKKITAVSLSKGVAAGFVRLFSDNADTLCLGKGSIEEEIQKFQSARTGLLERIDAVIENASQESSESEIREAFIEILEDEESNTLIINKIREGLSAKEAVSKVYEDFAIKMNESDDELLRSRASDLRMLASDMFDTSGISSRPEDFILVAEKVSPTKLLMSYVDNIQAIVSRYGGYNDHTAIIARMRRIPYVTGVDINEFADGENLIVDADEGLIIKNADEDIFIEYKKKAGLDSEGKKGRVNEIASEYQGKIKVLANVSSDKDFEELPDEYEGIGLLRLEAFYMSKTSMPEEAEIKELLESLSNKCNGKKVRVRTLDLGGDKSLSYLDAGAFNGLRGLALSLTLADEFEKEVRAICMAKGCFEIMFPVVEEVEDLKKAVSTVRKYSQYIKIGIMTETKKGVENLDELLPLCDFVSIGCNDLTADILGISRQETDSKEDDFDNKYNEVLKYIEEIINKAHKAGRKVCVCGEAASKRDWVEKFISLGLDEISIRLWD